MALTGTQFTISAGDYEATVVEVGAGLRRFVKGGVDVTAPYADDELPPRCDGAVLMPWPNRLSNGEYVFEGQKYQVPVTERPQNNANHGLARWSRWAPIAQEQDSITLACKIVPQTGWPFEISAAVTYSVDAETGLTVTSSVFNEGSGRAPFGAGFHPYLSLHGHALDEVVLQIPANSRIITDEAQVPVGQAEVDGSEYDFRGARALKSQRLDDAFGELNYVDGRGAVLLSTPSGSTQLWYDESFRFLQIFTAEVLAHFEPAVAVEPMTCPADAFNSGTGLIVLEPGGDWTGTWGVTPIG
ncbi:aldose 1-epimerase [Frankineae bacterium MT45]|nr:aldose 1-epimerase [Frankineae bacterium MT45]